MPNGEEHTPGHTSRGMRNLRKDLSERFFLTCLLLSHLMDIVVDTIVNFSDLGVFLFVRFWFFWGGIIFLKFEIHVLVLSIRVFKYNP